MAWVSARSCDLFKDSWLLWKRPLMSQWVLGAGPCYLRALPGGVGLRHPSICLLHVSWDGQAQAGRFKSFPVLRAHCVQTFGTQRRLPVCEDRTWGLPHCDGRSL